jgi:signal transduction histidine kinase
MSRMRMVNWPARGLGFAWLGLLTFVIAPTHGPVATVAQIVCYAVAGLAFAGWALTDLHPALAPHRDRVLPVLFGVLAAATGFASSAGGGGTFLVIFTAVITLAAAGDTDLPSALAVTAAGILGIDVSGLLFGADPGVLFGFPAAVIGGMLIGRNRAVYRVQAEQAATLLAQREELQAQQRRADLLDERARIAREIHDVLAHSLGALGIQIQAARSVLRKDPDHAGDLLAAAQQMAAEGLVETRRAVHALRAGTLPLDEELARASDAFAARHHVAVSFDTGGGPAALPPDATVALLRIAQEALVNAAKHAAGQGVRVRLDYSMADVRLTVRNDLAPGADETPPADLSTVNGGYGLTGMRERLRLLNGTLEAGPRDHQWVVTAELPRPA